MAVASEVFIALCHIHAMNTRDGSLCATYVSLAVYLLFHVHVYSAACASLLVTCYIAYLERVGGATSLSHSFWWNWSTCTQTTRLETTRHGRPLRGSLSCPDSNSSAPLSCTSKQPAHSAEWCTARSSAPATQDRTAVTSPPIACFVPFSDFPLVN